MAEHGSRAAATLGPTLVRLGVGAWIMTFPVAVTDEMAEISKAISAPRLTALAIFSVTVTCAYLAVKHYRGCVRRHLAALFARVVGAYAVSVSTAAIVLMMLGRTGWEESPVLALKRVALVALVTVVTAVFTATAGRTSSSTTQPSAASAST